MPPRFEVLEHTADMGLAAYGKDLKEALANAAFGLSSLMVDLDGVKEELVREIAVSAEDIEGLVVDWLNEFLFLFDAEGLIFKRFDIYHLDGNKLQARCYGEKFDPSRHQVKLGVKATTYHQLAIVKEDGYRLQVIFDI